jgi:hypothetical protein
MPIFKRRSFRSALAPVYLLGFALYCSGCNSGGASSGTTLPKSATFYSVDVPSTNGTFPQRINAAGAITGYAIKGTLTNPNFDFVGFVQTSDGDLTPFNGYINPSFEFGGGGQGIQCYDINSANTIVCSTTTAESLPPLGLLEPVTGCSIVNPPTNLPLG